MKKAKDIIILVSCTFLLLTGLIYIGLFQTNLVQQEGSIHFVLVNEDLGAELNGQTYNLGREFVYLINQDVTNQWQTTSRSIAESGMNAGTFDAMVILPQNFSENLLTLESFTPEQANIIYEIRGGQNDLANFAAQERVGEVLGEFRERITQMYFSSILGNLFEAQRSVHEMVSGEVDNKMHLRENVHTPFQVLPDALLTVASESEMMESQLIMEQESVWMSQEETFQTVLQESLEVAGGSFTEQLEALDAYVALQEVISQINRNNAQTVINRQAETDMMTYRSFFDTLNETAHEQVDAMDVDHIRILEMEAVDTGALDAFLTLAGDFSETQQARIEQLQGQIEALENLEVEMEALQGDVAKRFFGHRNRTPETVTTAQVEEAMRTHISEIQPNRPQLADIYLEQIETDIADLPMTDLEKVIHWLYERNMITKSQRDTYEKQLALVKLYADLEEVELLNPTEIGFVELEKNTHAPEVTFQQNTTFTMNRVATYEIMLQGSNVTFGNITGEVDRIQRQLNQSHPRFNPVVRQNGINNIIIQFTQPTLGQGETMPAFNPIRLAVQAEIIWSLGEDVQVDFLENDFRWSFRENNATHVWYAGQLSVFVDRNESIRQGFLEDFPSLLSYLSRLERATSQMVTIFGDEQELGLTLADFYQSVIHEEISFKELAHENSIYLRHGNLTEEERKNVIVEGVFDFFLEQGTMLFEAIEEKRTDLQAVTGTSDEEGALSLSDLLHHLTDPNFLVEEGEKLRVWYEAVQADQAVWLANWHSEAEGELLGELESWRTEANDALTRTFHTWENTSVVSLEVRELFTTAEGVSDEALYFNQDTGNLLLASVQTLMDMSQMQLMATGEGLERVTDLDDSFVSLITQTNEIKGNAEEILNSMDAVVSVAVERVESNQVYADNFNTVMENARVGGADNREVIRFLASPVALEGTIGEVERISLIPYFMTIIAVVLMMTTGYSMGFLEKKRLQKETDKVMAPSRMWQNTPIVVKAVAIASVVGLIFGVATRNVVANMQNLSWISYVFFVTVIGILFMTFFVRQTPKIAFYISSGMVGLYLFLTPLLGVDVKARTLVEWLFRLSPLQNIENGFISLMSQGQVDVLRYVAFVGLVMIGVGLNLLVKKDFGQVDSGS